MKERVIPLVATVGILIPLPKLSDATLVYIRCVYIYIYVIRVRDRGVVMKGR